MVEAGSIESIDMSILWKKAVQNQDVSYIDVVVPIVGKIVNNHLNLFIHFI